ncbi:related to D-xylose reductase II,III protein [Phialocephala subalpina]|uniref:Related to D-xylose reductase II,III protein n=1 Tax=Phialocephala subalpina TaxID=576137 RepID=A0A1L7WMK4_9HELO|nr:related to D-xylose reductase II,III protein [Phialocephala subalpina]
MASLASTPALVAPMAFKNHPETKIPKMVYGTAWKKDRSTDLVYQAIKSGFRAIDTAAQPRHYNEKGVAEGIAKAISEGILTREDLYIQTKFTPPSGQDPNNLPYDLSHPIPQQIQTSIASSLSNFTFPGQEEPYIDCLVLHSPYRNIEDTLLAWRTFEPYVPSKIRSLGISNTTLPILQSLVSSTNIPPSVCQNRFYPDTRYEVPLRSCCREQGIIFQSFWTLTGNPGLVKSKPVMEMAERLRGKREVDGDDRALALYSLVLGLEGVSVLNGTTNQERMMRDLLTLEAVGELVQGEWKELWDGWLRDFKVVIGEK